MNQPIKFEVLSKLKILMKYLIIYDKSKRFNGCLRFFKPLICVVRSLPLILYFIIPLRVSIILKFDLKIIASPLMVLLGTLQGALMYNTLATNDLLITETIDSLQQLVQKRIKSF